MEAGAWWGGGVGRAWCRGSGWTSQVLAEGSECHRRQELSARDTHREGLGGCRHRQAAKVRGGESGQNVNILQKAKTSRSQSFPKWVWRT